MQKMHLEAFCKLLSLPLMHDRDYIWDLAQYGYLVTRCRNFFRNYSDKEPVGSPPILSMRELDRLLIALDAAFLLLLCCEPGLLYLTVLYAPPGHFISHMPLYGTMDIGERDMILEDKLESSQTKFQISSGKG